MVTLAPPPPSRSLIALPGLPTASPPPPIFSWLKMEIFENEVLAISVSKCGEPVDLAIDRPQSTRRPRSIRHSFWRVQFCSPGPECCVQDKSTNILVFRSQCPSDNPFYPFDPLDTDLIDSLPEGVNEMTDFHNLCQVCGIKADLSCDKYSMVPYILH